MSQITTDYQQLSSEAGLVDFSDRSRLALVGTDRVSFLQSFCTNDISKLSPGKSCEAMITNAQGKIISHVLVACSENSLLLETTSGQTEELITHLDRYIIREDVRLIAHDDDQACWLLAGDQANHVLATCFEQCAAGDELPKRSLVTIMHDDLTVTIWRVLFTISPCYLVITEKGNSSKVFDALIRSGAVSCDYAAFDQLRIEAGWPMFGQDITIDNLPQEVGRSEQSISFTKGCYLGQETVARIDALGHVNKKLCSLLFSGSEIPASGTPLLAEGKQVGHVTSAIISPKYNAPLGIGYVRRGRDSTDTVLNTTTGDATIIEIAVNQ